VPTDFRPCILGEGLRNQEGLIGKYVDRLITRLKEVARTGWATDMVGWYTMTGFDVIGYLFHCLEAGEPHR